MRAVLFLCHAMGDVMEPPGPAGEPGDHHVPPRRVAHQAHQDGPAAPLPGQVEWGCQGGKDFGLHSHFTRIGKRRQIAGL